MRLVLALLFLIVLLNVSAHCPTTAVAAPDGCERLGATGLLHCPGEHSE